MILPKGEFAQHIGVSAGRVSQMIASGMIGPDALEGVGRSAKVRVAAAIEQIRRKRDVGQALGNGLSTRLELPLEAEGGKSAGDGEGRAGSTPAETGGLARPASGIDEQIKLERLQAEKRRNRIAAEEEAARRGRLVDATEMRAEMVKLARTVDEENAAMLADFAAAVAASFSVPQRDVLHLLRKVRTEKKGQAAERARRRAIALPETGETTIGEESVS